MSATPVVRMIEAGRAIRGERPVDRFATALYVETRIALVEMPDIRLRTYRPAPSRAVTAIKAAGYVGSYYGTCTMEISDELWWFEGIRQVAAIAAEEMRSSIARAVGGR